MAGQGDGVGAQEDEERRRRRRAIAWWWWLVGGLAVAAIAVLLLLALGGGNGDDDGTAGGDSVAATATPIFSGADATTAVTTAVSGEAASAAAGERDIEGVWEFIVDVTETNGACAGEENEDPGIDNVTIRRVGDNSYTVTGLGTTAEDEWTGRWDGDDFIFNGEREEDGGITVARFVIGFDDSGALTGAEDWTWSGSEGTCPDGKSTVEAFFYAPLN